MVDYDEEMIWHKVIEDNGLHIVPHVTKINAEKQGRLFTYFYPPRIGIDFYSDDQDPADEKPRNFIPNLELGDLARLVRILEILPKKAKFEVGLAFEKELGRRITIQSNASGVLFNYHAEHFGGPIDFEFSISTDVLEDLLAALKEAVLEYVRLILEFVVLERLDKKYILSDKD